jgi:hypothetical protein
MTSRRVLAPTRIVLAHGLPVVAAAVVIRWLAGDPVGPVCIEGAVYLGLFCALASVPAVQTLAASLGRTRRMVVRGLLAVVLLAQLTGAQTLYYPFTEWGMYSEVVDEPECVWYRYRGIGPAGEELPLAPQRLLGVRDPYLIRRIGTRLERHRSPGNDERALLAAVAGIGRLHNRRHPDRPIVAVEVVACREGLRSRGRPPGLRESVLCRVPVE